MDATAYPGVLLSLVSREARVVLVAPPVGGVELLNEALPLGFAILVVIHLSVLEEETGITEVGGDKLTSCEDLGNELDFAVRVSSVIRLCSSIDIEEFGVLGNVSCHLSVEKHFVVVIIKLLVITE